MTCPHALLLPCVTTRNTPRLHRANTPRLHLQARRTISVDFQLNLLANLKQLGIGHYLILTTPPLCRKLQAEHCEHACVELPPPRFCPPVFEFGPVLPARLEAVFSVVWYSDCWLPGLLCLAATTRR